MARIPEGAVLIANPVSVAPGFRIGNVFVLAGVPKIMQAMLEDVARHVEGGAPVISRTIEAPVSEGQIAERLAAIQASHPAVVIGSYPSFSGDGKPPRTALVVRGISPSAVAAADAAIEALLAEMSGPG